MYEQQYHEGSIAQTSFLITGGAGFIGSHIVEYLLKYGAKRVVVLDNFSTGVRENIEPFLSNPSFELIEGDIADLEVCHRACVGIDVISHQAALGSVPRSIKEPEKTTHSNVMGYVNMVVAARDAGIKRFVYASSSSVYGDSPILPKAEAVIGKPLSPYAITKLSNELYASNFGEFYGMEFIGFRYFNVFGPRQRVQGPYAAVIPLFMHACLNNEIPYINGDGLQTRDFTFVENVVQANVKAMLSQNMAAVNQVYNVGCGDRFSVLDLFGHIKSLSGASVNPEHRENRAGDVRDSLADISKISNLLGYEAKFELREGLKITLEYFKALLNA